MQLLLMGVTTLHPILPFDFGLELQGLQCANNHSLVIFHLNCLRVDHRLIVATTTIWSGLSYIFSKNAVRILSKREKLRP